MVSFRGLGVSKVRGEHAWIALALFVIGYDAVATDGELLSEAVDRFIEKRPGITRLIVAIVAAHLLNLIPDRFDPMHRAAQTTRRYRTIQTSGRLNVIDFERARNGRQAP